MIGELLQFLKGGQYAPHGYCLLWRPELIWTHVAADALIAAAYFSIPVALIVFVRRRSDIVFGWVFWLFAVFILACGTTHLMSIWNLWNSDYGISAVIKALTAAASVATAVILWPLLPRALAIPSMGALQGANDELAAALLERDVALKRLREEASERRAAEGRLVQKQKIEALGQLTGGIAHDFNNLLQAIGGSVQLIGRSPEKPERVMRWAKMAQEATDRAQRLTAQLLTFARAQSLSIEPVRLGGLIEGMEDLLRRTLGPSVRLELALEEDGAVAADRTQLELAILNLAINARDAMPDGGKLQITTATRNVTAHPDLAPGDYVVICVSDNGTGIPEDVVARVFDPFFTTKEAGKGTGLGLSMVHGFAVQAGGTVEIETASGEGTTVRIILRMLEWGADFPEAQAEDDEDIDLEGVRVFVVDDDDQVRVGLADGLEALGADVLDHSVAAKALEELARETVDIVIVDYAMPEMNGAEFAERLRQQKPDLPVVFATGYADFEAIEASVSGRAVVLRKPFRLTELARAIRASLSDTDAA